MKQFQLDGPIPGENFTSDTKNYPWHRAPDFTDLDEALDASAKKLMQTNLATTVITLLKSGATITTTTSIFLLTGVNDGKWTPDFALLMAGPVARMMEMMAKGYGIEYRNGWDEDEEPPTISYFKAMQPVSKSGIDKAIAAVDVDEVKDEAATKSKGGFMSPPDPSEIKPASKAEQMSMMGQEPDEELI